MERPLEVVFIVVSALSLTRRPPPVTGVRAGVPALVCPRTIVSGRSAVSFASQEGTGRSLVVFVPLTMEWHQTDNYKKSRSKSDWL